jgi:osmotically-inducible protein OsmY
MSRLPSLLLTAVAAAVLAASVAGCAPLIVGAGAVGTALMTSDRRSTGAQIDDEAIELRAATRLSEAMGDKVHINVTSYNRQVLLSGEVPTEELKRQAEQIVSGVDNVRSIINELAIMTPTTLPQRSGDVLITGKVRASLVDASDLQATVFKVVTEHGVVYLMGRVTPYEADRATSIARQINGVQRVVRVFEIATPQELRQAGVAIPPGAEGYTGTTAPVSTAPAAAPAAGSAPAPGTVPAQEPAPAGVVTTPVR